ncbi:hypothetical protein K435DRAFT_708618 [Dendrothele bispora CBS 962.96]|uniref:F-box domain-containing protein n=1 Tax=Dendrothele bispora (strain CBS 962.96) TaxID=1314807 RepID=A0A4S8MZQ4_DENBC|nr:hypothetical protein K435DRAFT_708618 [Dendrothele bispora CBS 962.96]
MYPLPDKSEILEQVRNVNPSDPTDIVFVKRQIARHHAAISETQEEVDNLLQEIRRLRFRQLEHQEAVRLYHGTITLARRLPREILASIFETCVRDGWTRTPFTVSHVCSQWRAAANIPTVWSRIYVNLDARDPYGRTLFWITKSQTVLLDISLEIHSDISSLSRIIDLLLSHCSRWRSLTVTSSVLSYANILLNQCSIYFPRLSALNVSITEEFDRLDGEDVILPALRTSFTNAPALRTLTITQNSLPSAGAFPPSMTSLSITLPTTESTGEAIVLSMNKLLNIIESVATQLKHLSVAIPLGQERKFIHDHDLTRSITLPLLESLILMGTEDLHVALFCLHTPALTRLQLISSVESRGLVDDVVGGGLVQLIQRSNPPLQSLQLRDVDISHRSFLDCFASLPKLKVLRLHDSEISNDVFEFLRGEQGYCPELSMLDLRWCGQINGSTLVRLVQSRSSSSTPIALITVINCSLVTEEDVLGLAQIACCRVIIEDIDEYCRAVRCCDNERYRRRLLMRLGNIVDKTVKLIL